MDRAVNSAAASLTWSFSPGLVVRELRPCSGRLGRLVVCRGPAKRIPTPVIPGAGLEPVWTSFLFLLISGGVFFVVSLTRFRQAICEDGLILRSWFLATLKDISGHVIFDLILNQIDFIDGVSDRYKYASFDIQLKHGDSVLRPHERNYISIQLIKVLISNLNVIVTGVLYKRLYDKRWAYFSLEPLDQSFILDIKFQGFEEENSSEETVEINLGFHSFMISQGRYPGYVITVNFSVDINCLAAFTHELENEFRNISEAYHVWSYEI